MGVFKEIEKADGSGVTTFYRLSDVHDTVETDDSEGTATIIDYNAAQNKPSVNGVTLVGNKTSEDLGLQPAGDYITNDEADAKFIDEDELEAKNYVNETRLQEAIANIDHFHREIVNALPVTGQDNVLYMVRKQGSGEDIFNEYIWVGKTASETGYEFIGTTATDLTDYYQKDEVDDLLDGKVDKVSGRGLSEQNYTLSEKTKLAGLHNYDDTELQVKVANLHNYDDTDLQLRVGDLEVKEEADSNAISTIQDALDKKMICIRLVEQGDGWTWMDINGSRLTFDRAQAYLGQENCMLFVEQLENDGKVIPAEYKSETTRIRVLFKDLDSLVHIMTLGEEDLLVEDIITTEGGACDFEVENEAVDFGARLDEFYGNTSQEVIAAEAGTEVVDKFISINDIDTSKENYITLKGDTSQDTTTGKNLFNINDTPSWIGSATSYSVANDILTVTGSWFIGYLIDVEKNTDYYIRADRNVITPGDSSTGKLAAYTSTKSYISQSTSGYLSFNSGDNSQIYILLYVGGVNETKGKVEFSNVQLEKGSTATSYEPYTGRKVSPNLDYSQNIHVVSGDNTFNISGKNKIGLVDGSYTSNNVTITVEDGIVKYNGTTGSSVSVFNIPLVHPVTLNIGDVTTYSATTTGTFSNDKMSIRLLTANGESWGNKYMALNGTVVKSSYTQIKKQTFTHAYLLFNPNTTLNVEIAYQLEYGNIASPVFEPYQGQILSVNLGVENLFDGAWELGTIDISTGQNASSNIVIRSINYIPVQPGTKYTISTENNCSIFTHFYNSSKEYLSYESVQNTPKTITTPSNCYYVRLRSRQSESITNLNLQCVFEKGTKVNHTSITPIELCKIDNYQDYFYKKNDLWYLHKEFGKVDLSTLQWQIFNTYARSTDLDGLIKYVPNNQTLGICLAEKYINHTGSGMSQSGDHAWIAVDVNAIVTNPSSGQSGLFYYQLATPTDTLVTNSTLSSQLDALYNATLYPMTNINTDANDLLPYIDLKYNVVTPAPSPAKPSDIKVVKGNNNIKAYNKNLFDGVLELGNWSTNDGSKLANSSFIINSHPIPVKELTNYKISLENENIDMYVFEYKKDMSYNLTARKLVRGESYLTTERETAYINFRPVNQNTNLHARIQVELGTTKTEYVLGRTQTFPFSLGQIELCKIGNYKDKIYKENDKWYLHKEIGKVVFDGTQAAFTVGRNKNNLVYFYKSLWDRKQDDNVISDIFPHANTWSATTNINGIAGATNNQTINIMIADTSITTGAQFNEWLSAHNTTVYYILNEPTDTEITDPTLLTQLENLQQITQYKHTYIDLIPAANNEMPNAQFTYISNAVINASDRVLGKDTYWNDEVPTSADLPSNAEEGEIRIVQDTQNVYIYDGYEWIPFDKGGEVDLSNYLAKDNTTAWIPTGAFNPATKKYVDDSVGGVFVPTKTSQLTNDSNFIGKNSNDLTYYYTKSQTYTKSEVDALIGGGGGGGNVSITVSGDTLVITTE